MDKKIPISRKTNVDLLASSGQYSAGSPIIAPVATKSSPSLIVIDSDDSTVINPVDSRISSLVKDRYKLLPGVEVDTLEIISKILKEEPVRVKGRMPDMENFQFSHHMLSIWASTEATGSLEVAVELIAKEFLKAKDEDTYRFLTRKPVSISTEDAQQNSALYKLIHLFFPPLKGKEHLLFDERRVYPFSWENLKSERIFLSLCHVDSRIKIILQDCANFNLIPKLKVPSLAEKAHLILTYLLKAKDYTLVRHVNNMLVLYLQDRVIQLLVGERKYREYRNIVMIPDLRAKNDAALLELKRILPNGVSETDDRILALQILAGVCFPQDRSGTAFVPIDEFTDVESNTNANIANYLAINDFPDLIADIASAEAPEIIFLLDDVGEGVFDLLFIQTLMIQIPRLKVTAWVNSFAVENNFWTAELYRVLRDPYFAKLNEFRRSKTKRLWIYETNTPLLCCGQRFFLDTSLLKWFEKVTAVVMKGCALFETTQLSETNTYYGFTNYNRATIEATGITARKGIFVHVPRGQVAFEYLLDEERFKTTIELRDKIRGDTILNFRK